MKLEKISNIQTGLVLARKRASVMDKKVNNYKMLTLRSFENSGWINLSNLDLFTTTEIIEDKYLTKKGDIVIRLTAPYTAVSISSETELLIPSNFAVIRILNSEFIPEFIALILNSKTIEKEFYQSSISTTIPLIKTSHLRNVNIIEKLLTIQKKIVNLYELQKKEGILLNKLLKQTTKLADLSLNRIITEE